MKTFTTFAAGLAAWTMAASSPQAATLSFLATGGVQTGTIVESGRYRVTVNGAKGGDSALGDRGGTGAAVSGEATLLAGTAFSVLVGGDGGPGESAGSNGGGGGGGGLSFFSSGALLAVAGGGGGGSAGGRIGTQGSDGGAGLGAQRDDGVFDVTADFNGGLGGFGGFSFAGRGGDGGFGGGGGGGSGGASSTAGAAGGGGASGGGGGGDGDSGGQGGGGGGYFGGRGGAGIFLFVIPSLGGGSFVSAAFQNAILTGGGAISGASVTVDLVEGFADDPAKIPIPAALPMLAAALGALGLLARRRARA